MKRLRIFALVFVATWSVVGIVWYETAPRPITAHKIEKRQARPSARAQHTYRTHEKAPGHSYLSAFSTLIDIAY